MIPNECSQCHISFENWTRGKVEGHVKKHLDEFNKTTQEELKHFSEDAKAEQV